MADTSGDPVPLALAGTADGDGSHPGPDLALPGSVTYQGDPQALFASESLAGALRQLEAYGRDGLPVMSGDGQQVQDWITSASVLHAVAAELGGSPPQAAQPSATAGAAGPAPGSARQEPPDPLPGYKVLEVVIGEDSPASGKTLGAITWPAGCLPVSVLSSRRLRGLVVIPSAPVQRVRAKRTPGTRARPMAVKARLSSVPSPYGTAAPGIRSHRGRSRAVAGLPGGLTGSTSMKDFDRLRPGRSPAVAWCRPSARSEWLAHGVDDLAECAFSRIAPRELVTCPGGGRTPDEHHPGEAPRVGLVRGQNGAPNTGLSRQCWRILRADSTGRRHTGLRRPRPICLRGP